MGQALGLSVFLVGCATKPPSKSPPSYQLSDVEGTWLWIQNPWHGDFQLKKDGDSCTGTLNDVYERTYGDKIVDVAVSDNRIKFTRNGAYGAQHWEGTLKREDGVLKIKDGRWTRERGGTGSFSAEKQR